MVSPQMNVFNAGNFQWTDHSDHSDESTRHRPWLGIIVANKNVRGVNNSQSVKIIYSYEEFLKFT